MQTQHYSIYRKNRPVKIAFLVAPGSDTSIIDAILTFNHRHWGGRYNPIVLCNGDEIQESWWRFLRDYDPDLIYSMVDLSEGLKIKLRTFITPISIIKDSSSGAYVRIPDQPLAIVPTQRIVSKIGHDIFEHVSNLVLFDVDQSAPKSIKHFIERNFGAVKSGPTTDYQMNRAIESCSTTTYKVTDFASLNDALFKLGEFHNRSVFFSQLCALPEDGTDSVEYDYKNERFSVIVGDSADDLSHYWNRKINRPDWLRPKLTELWLSREIAEEPVLQDGLSKFINRFTGLTGNSGQQGVHFSTLSLVGAELEQVKSKLCTKVHHPRTHDVYREAQVPRFSRPPFLVVPKNLEPYRASSPEEYLPDDEPSVEDGIADGEFWMTDLYIEYRPEEFKEYIGKSYWWQLPQRNGYINELGIVNRLIRVNKSGAFSVWMSRKNHFTANDPLIVKIPDSWQVFAALYCSEKFDCIENTREERFRSRPFGHLTLSDKGKYFNGILSLFPSITSAQMVLEDGFWRRIFEKLSNQNGEKDEGKVNAIKNTLRKIQPPTFDLEIEDQVNWLARKIFVLSKQVSKQAIDLTFEDIVQEKERFLLESRKTRKKSAVERHIAQRKLASLFANLIRATISYARTIVKGSAEHTFQSLQKHLRPQLVELESVDRVELQEDLSEFLERGILFMGIKPQCRRCGYRFWHSVNDMRQKMPCQGCGLEILTSAEEPWLYQLNHLARSAFSDHGTIPVLLTIAQLRFDARSSFMYMPSTALWEATSRGKDFRNTQEVDLSCIVDGKLVIGEVKQSVQLFKRKDFQNILTLAKKIRPDRVIFSSMDEGPNQLVSDEIARLKQELAALEVEVDWYRLRF